MAAAMGKAKSSGAGPPPQTGDDRGGEDRLAGIEADLVDALQIGPVGLYDVWRAPCRYCWGTGHLYQWKTAREYHDALETALMRSAPRPHADGGFGYRADGSPNPECPECCGLGEDRVRLCDLAQISRAARALIAGVRQGPHGPEVKIQSLGDLARSISGIRSLKGANGAEGAAGETPIVIIPSTKMLERQEEPLRDDEREDDADGR
jgi:hypothetical protein